MSKSLFIGTTSILLVYLMQLRHLLDGARLNQSRAHRILWLLEELKLEYELKVYKRGSDMLAPPELKEIHPLGKSPILGIQGPDMDKPRIIIESGVIVEYLIEHFGPSLIPRKYPEGREGQVGHETEEWLRWRTFSHYAEGSMMPPMLVSLVSKSKPLTKLPGFGLVANTRTRHQEWTRTFLREASDSNDCRPDRWRFPTVDVGNALGLLGGADCELAQRRRVLVWDRVVWWRHHDDLPFGSSTAPGRTDQGQVPEAVGLYRPSPRTRCLQARGGAGGASDGRALQRVAVVVINEHLTCMTVSFPVTMYVYVPQPRAALGGASAYVRVAAAASKRPTSPSNGPPDAMLCQAGRVPCASARGRPCPFFAAGPWSLQSKNKSSWERWTNEARINSMATPSHA